MMQPTRREKIPNCLAAGAYRYHIPMPDTATIWEKLQQTYGNIRVNNFFKIMEIDTQRFNIKATSWGRTPITIMFKTPCTKRELAKLHTILNY